MTLSSPNRVSLLLGNTSHWFSSHLPVLPAQQYISVTSRFSALQTGVTCRKTGLAFICISPHPTSMSVLTVWQPSPFPLSRRVCSLQPSARLEAGPGGIWIPILGPREQTQNFLCSQAFFTSLQELKALVLTPIPEDSGKSSDFLRRNKACIIHSSLGCLSILDSLKLHFFSYCQSGAMEALFF